MKPPFYILSVGLFSALTSYAWHMNRNRRQICQERQKADLLRKDLQQLKAEQEVNEAIIETLLQNQIDKIQQLSSTYFYWSDEAVMLREALEGKAMKEEIIAAFRQDLRHLRDNTYFISNIEKALDQAQGQLMQRLRNTVGQTPDLQLDETDYALLTDGTWQDCALNRRAAISPVRGQGLLTFENDCVVRERIDVVFPVLHGVNGEDGSIQGLLQIAGIPCVGSNVAASAVCMDKALSTLVAQLEGIRQAAWVLVTRSDFARDPETAVAAVEGKFSYPVFVKPSGTGSSVGVSRAGDRVTLLAAIENALQYDGKVLVEERIVGQEVEVAVLGNETPVASVCGEIDSGEGFYDYDAKYVSDNAKLYVPARISDEASEKTREIAVRVYRAMGCSGLARVDFFVTADGEVVFNEINSLPGFTSISMYPKLFTASGMTYPELIDRLLELALEK